MKNIKRFGIALGLSLVLILGTGFGYVYSKLNSIYVKDRLVNRISRIEEGKEQHGTMVEGLTNILLVGTDGENVDKTNRSDSVMLVTIDSNNNDIKISSIARDTYVDIPGHSREKLNHAYAYGGIDLLKEVFKVNFDLDIDKYIAVNFVSFMDIMDELGGVKVNVAKKDIDEINKYIDQCYEYYYSRKNEITKQYIQTSGEQRLNGYQALAFSRIRKTDSAIARDNRHREVAQSVYKEFLTKGPQEYKKCTDIILNNTKTNISPLEMMNLGYTVMKIKDKNIEQFQFPLAEHRNGHIINDQKGWVLEWDKEPNLEVWHDFIYGGEQK